MSHPDKKQQTKEKILQSTLEFIQKEGFEAVTIRKIADLSSTNISLVNYYFGSKENLLSEAIEVILNSFQHTFSVLDNTAIPPQDRLKQFLLNYLQVIRQYPELLSRIIVMGSTPFTSQQEYGRFLMGFPKVQNTIRELTGEQQSERLLAMMLQIFGAIFLPALMSPILESGAVVEMPSIEEQLNLLFERYFDQK
ncbi:TetR/AcrR family transcriptional regulator [Paenibacillus sp. CMAA1739]|uniref:TetR/AcrR family transcriptional regulator n=1 Tax=Paenibacillus ottowii TaxID=2315729 RepID=UPI0027303709|nr:MULTISPECIES: TetR/AcrR family transcriptional regulator [Paenibacillus]MDP1512727.1 TetR/AcrR family transcriptional regulator [Paenibacillus ottowii]MEC4568795.1 TetR/AcrR family transcriptional regulator [Paenibacillus sp. CMAA1739]